MTSNLTHGLRWGASQRRSEYELREVYLPRGTSRNQARSVLTEQAEYGAWELARLRLYPDGSRRVWLRRKIIRAMRTLDFDQIYDA